MAGNSDALLALRIETTADLTGVRSARAETSALGAAVKTAADETAASNQKITLSQDQARKAAAEAGGDFEKLQQILRRMTAEETNLATAAAKTTAELQKQAKTPVLQGPTGPQLGPALPGTPRGGGAGAKEPKEAARGLGLAELAAYRQEAERAAVTTAKIPPAARTASNSLGLLTQAALTGQGGMNGIAVAAGNVAQGISLMSGSAKVAATASGVGALIAITVLAVEALEKMNFAAKNTQVTMDHIGAFSTRQLGGARTELAAIDEQLGAAQKKAADASKYDITNIAGTGVDILSVGARVAQQELDNLLEKKTALHKKIGELEKADIEESRQRTLASITIEAQAQITSQSRYAARIREIDAQATESVRKRELTQGAADQRAATQKRELAKQGEDYVQGLAEAATASRDALTAASFQARINAADRAAAKEKEDLQDRALSVQDEEAAVKQIEQRRRNIQILAYNERNASLAASVAKRQSESDDPREVLAGKLAAIDAEYLADVKLLGVKEALLNAEEKRRKLEQDSIKRGLDGYGALSTAVKNHGTVVGAMAKASADAVRIYEIYEKGKSAAISAQIEGAASLAAFASGNIAGGALHAAAAVGYGAAAIAAGAEAAGVVSGGGGGGAAGGAGSGDFGSSTFTPRDNSAGGGQTLVFQMVNPASGEVLRETIYQIGRSGVLKQPIRPGSFGGLVVAATG